MLTAAISAKIESPFFNVAQPRTRASITVWPLRAGATPRHVIIKQNQHSSVLGRCIETVGGEIEDGYDLFPRNWVLFDDFIYGYAVVKILENESNRRPRIPKRPTTAHLAGNAFHGGALGPIETCHVLTLSFIVAFTRWRHDEKPPWHARGTLAWSMRAPAVPLVPASVSERARRRITRRLIPFLFVLYIVAFLDRVNTGYAGLQMTKDLHFSNEVFGFGSGIFFIGYVLLEIPGTLLVEMWSARKWIARIMITWGFVAALTGLVNTAPQFYWARFLLGVAEAGFFPGVIV